MSIDRTSQSSQYRANCTKKLIELNPQKHTYFIELENRIYELVGKLQHENQIYEYYRKYIQLFFNLKRYTDYLTDKYTPSEIIYLDSSKLNPKYKQEIEENQIQNLKYKNIQDLKMDNDDSKDNNENDEDDDDDGSMQCSKCKKRKNISIMQRQLRSADEPMTLFMTCNNCHHHWRKG
jgi:transcription elongation factor S-II